MLTFRRPWCLGSVNGFGGGTCRTTHGDPAASDERIWTRTRQPGRIILIKDQDFVDRGILYGPPPIVIQVNLGNCSNRRLMEHLDRCWPTIALLIQQLDASVVTIEWLAIGLRTTNRQ